MAFFVITSIDFSSGLKAIRSLKERSHRRDAIPFLEMVSLEMKVKKYSDAILGLSVREVAIRSLKKAISSQRCHPFFRDGIALNESKKYSETIVELSVREEAIRSLKERSHRRIPSFFRDGIA